MSAFVKLVSTSGAGSYLGIPMAGKGMFRSTKDSMGLRSHASAVTSEGEIVTEVKLNQVVTLRPPVDIKPRRYTLMTGFNPELSKYGMVSNPGIFAEGDEIFMTFKAFKNVDLAELSYIFTYYMVD